MNLTSIFSLIFITVVLGYAAYQSIGIDAQPVKVPVRKNEPRN